ncbi:MAG TPA: hypothetical protein VMT76_06930 [Puia sp.]|nr:hypothetical protein [Puia sp.]
MKNKNSNSKYLLAVFFAVSTMLLFLLVLWKKIGSTGRFNLIIVLIFLRYVFLIAAILSLALRLIRRFLSNSGFIYALVCALNIAIGFFSSIFYFFHEANIWWLNQTLLNLLFGFIMLLDMVIFREGRKIS